MYAARVTERRDETEGKKTGETGAEGEPLLSIHVRSVAYGPPSLEAIADRVPRRVDIPPPPPRWPLPTGRFYLFSIIARSPHCPPPRRTHGEKKVVAGWSWREVSVGPVPAAIYELPIPAARNRLISIRTSRRPLSFATGPTNLYRCPRRLSADNRTCISIRWKRVA